MAEIRYRFVASGQDEVIRTFKTIADSAKRSAKERGDAERRSEKDSAASARRAAQDVARADAQRFREFARLQQLGQKMSQSATTHASKEARAAERSGQARVRAEERIADGRIRAMRRVTSEAERLQQRESRAAERHARRATRGQASGGGSGIIGTAIGTAVGGAALNGLSYGAEKLVQVAKAVNETQELANRLSVSSRQAGQDFASPDALRREMERTALATPGITSDAVGGAMSAFVSKTGDLNAARRFAGTFATTASAAGADMTDVASAGAALREKFGITDDAEMRKALASIYMQGKAGSFELKDAAGHYDKLTAASQRFGLDKGLEGVRTLGGLTQIARTSTGSSDQAAFAVEAMFRQLTAKSGDIQKVTGAKVFTDDTETKARDVQDVIVDVIKGAKGNLPDLQKLFGEEGIRGVSPMITAFNDAARAAGKNATESERLAAGEAAIRDMFARSISVAGDWSDVTRDAAQAQQNASAQWTAASEKIKAELSDALAPAITNMAKALTSEGATAAIQALGGAARSASEDFLRMMNAMAFLGLIKPEQKREGTTHQQLEAVRKERKQLDGERVLRPLSGVEKNRLDALGREEETLVGKYNEETGAARQRALTGEDGTRGKREGIDALDTIIGPQQETVTPLGSSSRHDAKKSTDWSGVVLSSAGPAGMVAAWAELGIKATEAARTLQALGEAEKSVGLLNTATSQAAGALEAFKQQLTGSIPRGTIVDLFR